MDLTFIHNVSLFVCLFVYVCEGDRVCAVFIIFTCMYMCMCMLYVYVYVCICVYVYVCVYVCVCVCKCVSMSVCIKIISKLVNFIYSVLQLNKLLIF